MDTIGIANMATNVKMLHVQTEVAFKAIKMTMDMAEQEGAGLMKMLDAAMTGLGQNIDMAV